MRFFILCWLGMALLLSGCAAEKHYSLSETDTENGTVSLAYDFSVFERPQIVNERADATAGRECLAMGYGMVKMPPKRQTKCLDKSSAGDCVKTRVIRTYECAGGKTEQKLQKKKSLEARSAPQQLTKDAHYLYRAEQAARSVGCNEWLKPESLKPGKEVYSTVCRGGVMHFTCTSSSCSMQ